MSYRTSEIEALYGSISELSERKSKNSRGSALTEAGLTFKCDLGDPMNCSIKYSNP